MHIHALDTYRPGHSPVHRLDPRVKLILTVLFILVCALTSDGGWVFFGIQAVLLGLLTLLSGVGLVLVYKRAAVAIPFSLAALTVAFSTPGNPVLSLGVPSGQWVVTDTGLVRFLSILIRSYLSVQSAVILAAATPFPDLLWAMRSLRIPKVMVAIGSFLYRYLFVLADEAHRLMRAREARSVVPDTYASSQKRPGGSLLWRAQVTGSMAGTLFIRSYERSERIYSAMLARGYDGDVRSLEPPALRPVDVAIGIAAGLVLVALLILAKTMA
jgi:cobalt/nickel transport system permease protein